MQICEKVIEIKTCLFSFKVSSYYELDYKNVLRLLE